MATINSRHLKGAFASNSHHVSRAVKARSQGGDASALIVYYNEKRTMRKRNETKSQRRLKVVTQNNEIVYYILLHFSQKAGLRPARDFASRGSLSAMLFGLCPCSTTQISLIVSLDCFDEVPNRLDCQYLTFLCPPNEKVIKVTETDVESLHQGVAQ